MPIIPNRPEYIFDITFSIRKSTVPFDIVKSMGETGGNLDEVIKRFQEEFGQYLRTEVIGVFWWK